MQWHLRLQVRGLLFEYNKGMKNAFVFDKTVLKKGLTLQNDSFALDSVHQKTNVFNGPIFIQ